MVSSRYINEKIMHNLIFVTVYSKKIFNMFLVSEVSGLVKYFNTGIFSDTVNVIDIKLCMMVLLIELYLFVLLSVTLTIFQGHSNAKQF